jgi:flagellar motor protein MotB
VRTSWRAVAASLTLHALLVLFVGLRLIDPAHEQTATQVVVEIQEPVKNQVLKKVHSGPRRPKSAEVLANGLTQQQTEAILFPKTNYADISKQVAQNTQNEKLAQIEANSERGRIRNSGLNQVFGDDGNRNWAHNQDIYTRIDSHLKFDSLLAQYNHFGAVLVQFNLDDQGLLLLNSLKVKAADPILKVHVLRAMQAGLSDSSKETKGNKNVSEVAYQARFDFNRGDSDGNFVKQQSFGQPVFVFQRSTSEKPIADNMAGQLADLSLLGNPLLIGEKIEKYNRKKRRENLKFDPFESYRQDPFYIL